MVKRFSQKLLAKIEDKNMKGDSISKIARDLKITQTDVKNGLNKLFTEEIEEE